MNFRTAFERGLEIILLVLMSLLALLVVVAVVFRKSGAALVWYDEVASIMLAWLTYLGAVLAALRGAHIGFSGLTRLLSPRPALLVLAVRELCMLSFLTILLWAGVRVLTVLEGTFLVSLPWMPSQFAHLVVPLSAILFLVAELTNLPRAVREIQSREE